MGLFSSVDEAANALKALGRGAARSVDAYADDIAKFAKSASHAIDDNLKTALTQLSAKELGAVTKNIGLKADDAVSLAKQLSKGSDDVAKMLGGMGGSADDVLKAAGTLGLTQADDVGKFFASAGIKDTKELAKAATNLFKNANDLGTFAYHAGIGNVRFLSFGAKHLGDLAKSAGLKNPDDLATFIQKSGFTGNEKQLGALLRHAGADKALARGVAVKLSSQKGSVFHDCKPDLVAKEIGMLRMLPGGGAAAGAGERTLLQRLKMPTLAAGGAFTAGMLYHYPHDVDLHHVTGDPLASLEGDKVSIDPANQNGDVSLSQKPYIAQALRDERGKPILGPNGNVQVTLIDRELKANSSEQEIAAGIILNTSTQKPRIFDSGLKPEAYAQAEAGAQKYVMEHPDAMKRRQEIETHNNSTTLGNLGGGIASVVPGFDIFKTAMSIFSELGLGGAIAALVGLGIGGWGFSSFTGGSGGLSSLMGILGALAGAASVIAITSPTAVSTVKNWLSPSAPAAQATSPVLAQQQSPVVQPEPRQPDAQVLAEATAAGQQIADSRRDQAVRAPERPADRSLTIPA